MNEADVIQKARTFVAGVGQQSVPPDLSAYVKAANAKVMREELGERESGTSMRRPDGKHVIVVNSLEASVRQNFTICHELAHIILDLPSNHQEVPAWGYVKRDPNEWMCDLFAAELLMPYGLWAKTLPPQETSRELIEFMAASFGCSFPAAASRYATLARCPCAYVTMSHGTVRFAAMSTSLRRVGARIPSRSPVPPGSVAHRLRGAGIAAFEQDVVAQDVWFQDWNKGLDLSELARHDVEHDSTVSLLWFEDEDLPDFELNRFGVRQVDDGGLSELDGQLPWPSGKRRR
jgi:Zn-dependent peptidase ImmA (M78 family)